MVETVIGANVEESANDSALENDEMSLVRKRGRPSNPNKVEKLPSGRGRGRPKKYDDGEDKPSKPQASNYVPREPYVKGGRGRPRKLGKPKISQIIVATGKGRGRPKNPNKSSVSFTLKKVAVLKKTVKTKKNKGKQRGRPKKESLSDGDDEALNNEDDYEERRPLGRPPTGAVNLNIVATGRGQGRPKKNAIKRPAKNDSGGSPRKRGRPTLGQTIVKPKGINPRGRPKKSHGEINNTNTDNDINTTDNPEDSPSQASIFG